MIPILARIAVIAALGLYAAVVLWLVITGKPGHMMAGAILACAPVVIGLYESLRRAAAERERIAEEVHALREELKRGRDALL